MKKDIKNLRVAIVADWLTTSGGAENVIASFINIFPQADVFTTVFISGSVKGLEKRKVQTSSLQKFPKFLRKRHQLFLPFLPKAIESLDLSGYDLVLSSSSFVGKGCLTDPETLHICYCHTPTRYLWDTWQEYIREFPLPFGFNWLKRFLPAILTKLRRWDRLAAERPDRYIANSHFIAERIRKYYQKESVVIAPPLNFGHFAKGIHAPKLDYFVTMGRLTPYKRFDLLIEAFRELPKKTLKIIGDGPDMKRLQRLAKGAPNITLLGFVPNDELPHLLGSAQAFLFPQIEDAGIALMEALATGTPAIALQKGGALDVLEAGKNGIFFEAQTAASLEQALERFAKMEFDRKEIQGSVRKFSRENFETAIKDFILGCF